MFDALPIWLKNRRAGQRGCRQLWVSAWSLAPSPVPSGPAKPGSAWWGPGASAFLALWVITKVSGGADWDHPGPSDLQAHLPWGEGCRGRGGGWFQQQNPPIKDILVREFFSFLFRSQSQCGHILISIWTLLGLKIMSDLDSQLAARLIRSPPGRQVSWQVSLLTLDNSTLIQGGLPPVSDTTLGVHGDLQGHSHMVRVHPNDPSELEPLQRPCSPVRSPSQALGLGPNISQGRLSTPWGPVGATTQLQGCVSWGPLRYVVQGARAGVWESLSGGYSSPSQSGNSGLCLPGGQ